MRVHNVWIAGQGIRTSLVRTNPDHARVHVQLLMEELRAIEPIAHHPRELSTGSVVHFFDNINSTLSPTFSPDHPKGGEVYMYVRRPPSQERTNGCKGIDVHHKPNYTAWYKKATFAMPELKGDINSFSVSLNPKTRHSHVLQLVCVHSL